MNPAWDAMFPTTPFLALGLSLAAFWPFGAMAILLGVAMAAVLHSWITRERLEPEGSFVRDSMAWAPPGTVSSTVVQPYSPPSGYCSIRCDASGSLIHTNSDGSSWVTDDGSKQWLADMSQALKATGYLA